MLNTLNGSIKKLGRRFLDYLNYEPKAKQEELSVFLITKDGGERPSSLVLDTQSGLHAKVIWLVNGESYETWLSLRWDGTIARLVEESRWVSWLPKSGFSHADLAILEENGVITTEPLWPDEVVSLVE